MLAYSFDPAHAAHHQDGHPERPARLDAAIARLEVAGVLATMRRVPAQEAPRTALERVHDEAYLDLLETISSIGGAQLDPDTYATQHSYAVALRAVGGVLGVTDEVLSGEASSGIALVRPPGHHARAFAPMGFCLLGNVAIGVNHARATHGIRRVLVVDFDVHHGNGTQEAFYGDPDVLFISSQQFPFWPGTGAITETGVDEGAGATVNMPLPPGTGDALPRLYERVLPVLARRFRPDAVFVSAGYDAHWLDPVGGLALSIEGIADIVRVIMDVADEYAGGRVIAALEGGYHAGAVAAGVLATVRAMDGAGAPVDDPFGPAPVRGSDLVRVTEALVSLHGL